MKTLDALLDDYLAMRRAMGCKLEECERLVRHFPAYLESQDATFITTALALQWAVLPEQSKDTYRARRLAEVRHFAQYAQTVDRRHEAPPQGLVPHGQSRRHPYIYTDSEIATLIGAAQNLPGDLKPLTYAAIIGLLSVTGMRSGEIVQLDRGDVDLSQQLITVRNSKFGKSRLIPCHSTTSTALGAYAARRDKYLCRPKSAAFFLSEQSMRINAYTLRDTFAKLTRIVGLRGPEDEKGPRLHDLRHRFAVNTLMKWYREGDQDAIAHYLPDLATWLGHVNIISTYWYLSAVPELMEPVAQHIDRLCARCPS